MPNCWIYTNSPNMCIHIWLHSSSLVNCPSLVNFLKSWEELSRICGSCKIISISRTVLRPSAVKYSRGGTLVGGNWLPVSYVPGFYVVLLWTWECYFWRLTGWFSKCYLQQRHQYRLMQQYPRYVTWVVGNYPPWLYVLGF